MITEYPTLRFEVQSKVLFSVHQLSHDGRQIGEIYRNTALPGSRWFYRSLVAAEWSDGAISDLSAFMAELSGEKESTRNIYAVHEADTVFSLTADAGLVYDGPMFRAFKIVVDVETYNLLEAWMKEHGGLGSVNIPLNGGNE
jgi:hypothetical protein